MKLLVVFMGLLLSSTVMAKEVVKSECAELLITRCESCHYLERICGQVGKKSKRRWKTTLKRMVKRRGAQLNGDEQEILLRCLAGKDPAIVNACSKSSGAPTP